MVGRRDQETNRLPGRIGNRFSFGPRYGFGIERIEYDHALAGRDDPAVQIAGTEHVMAGNDLAYAAGLAALCLLGVRRSATQENDNQSHGWFQHCRFLRLLRLERTVAFAYRRCEGCRLALLVRAAARRETTHSPAG